MGFVKSTVTVVSCGGKKDKRIVLSREKKEEKKSDENKGQEMVVDVPDEVTGQRSVFGCGHSFIRHLRTACGNDNRDSVVVMDEGVITHNGQAWQAIQSLQMETPFPGGFYTLADAVVFADDLQLEKLNQIVQSLSPFIVYVAVGSNELAHMEGKM